MEWRRCALVMIGGRSPARRCREWGAQDVRAGLRADNGFKQVTWQSACVAVQVVNHSSIIVDQEKASNKTSDIKGPLARVEVPQGRHRDRPGRGESPYRRRRRVVGRLDLCKWSVSAYNKGATYLYSVALKQDSLGHSIKTYSRRSSLTSP